MPYTRDLHRITVNLTPRAHGALIEAAGLSGDTKTDTISRALQVHAYLLRVMADGDTLLVRSAAGEIQKLMIL